MDYSKIGTYKSKFRLLFTIVIVLVILIIYNSIDFIKSNNAFLESKSGILFYVYLVFLIILLGLILYNLVKYGKLSAGVVDELNEIRQENIASQKKHEIKNKTDNDSGESSAQNNILREIFEGIDKEKDVNVICEQFLIKFSKKFEIVQGLFYLFNANDKKFKLAAKYAFFAETEPLPFVEGEGLTGQVVKNMKPMTITELSEKYLTILSGLGTSSPSNLIILPVINDSKTIGIIELASFIKLDIKENELMEFLNENSSVFLSKENASINDE